jgi:S1-C subfamily serine protease
VNATPRFVGATLALLMMLPAGCEARPPYERSRAAVMTMETGVGQCTATAVGPHVILSAEHCGVSAPGRIELDGVLADVVSVTRDGHDHVLIRVDATFKHWLARGHAPRPGDPVYLIGSPEGLKKVLRIGYFIGQVDAESPEATAPAGTGMYDIECGHGDSGAAILDKEGRIIGVLTGGYTPTSDFRLIRAIPIGFTDADWKGAQR